MLIAIWSTFSHPKHNPFTSFLCFCWFSFRYLNVYPVLSLQIQVFHSSFLFVFVGFRSDFPILSHSLTPTSFPLNVLQSPSSVPHISKHPPLLYPKLPLLNIFLYFPFIFLTHHHVYSIPPTPNSLFQTFTFFLRSFLLTHPRFTPFLYPRLSLSL